MRVLRHPFLCALGGAALLCLLGSAHALDPNAGRLTPHPGLAATCSTLGYTRPSGLACKLIASPPAKQPPWSYVAYSCEAPAGSFIYPGGCAPGFVKSGDKCKPGPQACAAAVAQNKWQWKGNTMPLTQGGVGHRCPYSHFTLQG